jgi:hypothetical protein
MAALGRKAAAANNVSSQVAHILEVDGLWVTVRIVCWLLMVFISLGSLPVCRSRTASFDIVKEKVYECSI